MYVSDRFLSFLVVFLWSNSIFAAPENFTYQGQIIKPNGMALEATTVNFTIEILSPLPSACVLYSEGHTINMSNSNGLFAIKVGAGSQSGTDFEDTSSLADALNNFTGTVSPTTCGSGSTYTPTTSDGRQLRVTFDDGSGPVTLTQNHQVVSVPYAYSASSIDGISSADLLTVNTSAGVVLDQTNLEWLFGNSARYAELQALINGTSTQYFGGAPAADVDMNNNKVINVSTPTLATDAANKNYVDLNIGGQATDSATLAALAPGDAGEVLTWNGTQWTTAPAGADSTKLPLAGGTMSGSINMDGNSITNALNVGLTNDLTVGNNATVTGTMSSAGVSTSGELRIYSGANYMGFQAPAGGADLIWTLPAVDGTSGQVLKTNGGGTLYWDTDGTGVATVFGRTGTVTAATSDYDAIQIDNTPAGNIAATNVQAAIDELDNEKLNLAGGNMTGAIDMRAENEIRFSDNDNSHYVGFKAPATITAAASFVWELPVDDGTSGQVLRTNGAGVLSWVTPSAGVTDHGALTGLTDDDHTQYALLAGRTGGQTLIGGTAASDDITIESTSNATKGDVLIQPNGGNVGIGTTTPSSVLEIDSGSATTSLHVDSASNSNIEFKVGGTTRARIGSGGGTTYFSNNYPPNNLAFQTSGTTQMVMTPAGAVGIGTANPGQKFDVEGRILSGPIGTATGETGSILMEELAANGTNVTGFRAPDDVGASDIIYTLPGAAPTAGQMLSSDASGNLSWVAAGTGAGDLLNNGNSGAVVVGSNDSTLSLEANNSVMVHLLANGNVGVGTITPSARLDLEFQSTSATSTSAMTAGTDAGFSIRNSDPAAQHVGLRLVTRNSSQNSALIALEHGSSFDDGRLLFRIRDGASSSNEIMTLHASGEVGIGTTVPEQKLDVEGRILSGPVGTAPSETGSILMEELAVNGTNVTGFRAPDNVGASDIIYTLPGTAPTAGQILSSDASGNLSWIAAGGTGDFKADGTVPMTGELVLSSENDPTHPELTFSGDADTGLYHAAANQIGFSTNGILRFTLNNGGLVGPSTSSAEISSSVGIEATPAYTFKGSNAGMWLESGTENLAFSTNSLERVRIDSNGNVGIGTNSISPFLKLQVNGNLASLRESGPSNITSITSSDSSSPMISTVRSKNTWASPSYVENTDIIGSFFFFNHDAINGSNIRSIATEDHSSSARGANLSFYTVPNGGTGSYARLTIDQNGNVGIGTSTPFEKMDVEGRILSGPMGTGAGQAGSILMEELAANGTNKTGFRAPDNVGASDIIYTLPGTAPTAGQILSSDASGNLSWVADATGGGGGALSDLTAASGTNSINNSNNAQTWNWNGLTTQTALTLQTNTLTSGSVLSLVNATGETSSTGSILKVAASGDNDNASTALEISHMGRQASSTGAKITMSDADGSNSAKGIILNHEGGVGTGIDLNMNKNGGSSTIGIEIDTEATNSQGLIVNMNNNDGGNSTKGVVINSISTGTGSRGLDIGMNNTSFQGRAINVSALGSGTGLYVQSNNGTAARFSSTNGYGLLVESGNVGIGSATPSNRLEIMGTGIQKFSMQSTDASSPELEIQATSGANGSARFYTNNNLSMLLSDGGVTFGGSYFSQAPLSIDGDIGVETTQITSVDQFNLVLDCKAAGTPPICVFSRTSGFASSTDSVDPNKLNIDYHASNDHRFFRTGAASPTAVITNTSVGIGTDAPLGTLDVNGDIRMLGATSGYTGFKAPATAPNLVYNLPATAPTAGQILSSDASGNMSWIAAGGGGGYVAGDTIRVANGSTSAPGLAFNGDTNTGIYRQSTDTIGFVGGGVLGMIVSDGAVDIFHNTQFEDGEGPQWGMGADAYIRGTGGGSSEISFGTNGSESMIIDDSGNVGIGTGTPSHILHINGQGRSTNSAWATTSDRRLKDVHGGYEYGLKEISQLQTYRFSYKEDNFYGLPSDKQFSGVMAQELMEIIPEAVEEDSNGFYTVNTDPIFWALVNSTSELKNLCQASQKDLKNIAQIVENNQRNIASLQQENSSQNARLQNLEKENQNLREQNQKLNQRLDQIEKMLLELKK